MNKRPFYLAAVLFALVSLIVHAQARDFLMDAMHRKVARISLAQREHTAYTPDPQALQSRRRYDVLTLVGVALTGLSAVCLVMALLRRESGWYALLVLFLVFDILVPMLL